MAYKLYWLYWHTNLWHKQKSLEHSKLNVGLDGMDGLDGLSYTAVTPRASLQSDANNIYRHSGDFTNFLKSYLGNVQM